jgi:hypothetical protein
MAIKTPRPMAKAQLPKPITNSVVGIAITALAILVQGNTVDRIVDILIGYYHLYLT